MTKNIIFDWSGVVRDTMDCHLWIVNKMFEKYNIHKLSFGEYRENWQQPYMLFYNKYVPNMTIEEENILYKEASSDKDCPKSTAYSGMVELVKKLKERGCFLAIVSSDNKETILPEFKEFGLENIFEDIEIEVHDKLDSVVNIIKKRNLNKDNTYFVGDSNHEIEVAKATGIKSVAVTWGFATAKNLKSGDPDFIVNNVKELEDILLTK